MSVRQSLWRRGVRRNAGRVGVLIAVAVLTVGCAPNSALLKPGVAKETVAGAKVLLMEPDVVLSVMLSLIHI